MSCAQFLKTAALVKQRLPHLVERCVILAICDIEGVPGSLGYEKARLDIQSMQCKMYLKARRERQRLLREMYGDSTPLYDSEDQESSYNDEDDRFIEAFA
eukprot:8347299-Karenia_brevis.AAC.1